MAESDCTAAGLLRILEMQRAGFQRALLSTNTQRGYRYDWGMFQKWCGRMERSALPATSETVSLYATDQIRGCADAQGGQPSLAGDFRRA
jgi:hypothetical protein